MAWCATCHQADAQGSFDGELTPLFHNTSLGRPDANNLMLVMLEGVHRQSDVAEMPMPGFGQLSDHQLATLGTWLTQGYGNPAALVTAQQVRTLRHGDAPSSLVAIVRVAIAVVVIGLLLAALVILRRRRVPIESRR